MFQPTAPLVTPRLTLRPLDLADWPAIHSFTGDAEVQRYISGAPLSEKETRDLIEMLRDWERERPPRARPYAFVHSARNEVIGFGGLYWTGDQKRWQAELGYTLHRAWWGQGYATEAGAALIAWAFAQRGVRRIFADCLATNSASARVLAKLGLRQLPARGKYLNWELTAKEYAAKRG